MFLNDQNGGFRQLQKDAEIGYSDEVSTVIQSALEQFLKKHIPTASEIEITHRWSGIMGVGNQKKAIVKQISNNVFCGVRLGGMGVAIGSIIGNELADEI